VRIVRRESGLFAFGGRKEDQDLEFSLNIVEAMLQVRLDKNYGAGANLSMTEPICMRARPRTT
jgi:hypothetical protein